MRLVVCGAAFALPLVLSSMVFGASKSPVADAAMNGDIGPGAHVDPAKGGRNAPQADGATAIQWAAYRNDLSLADVLIAAGANVKIANREGATPLYLASLQGSSEMIQKLLEAGADVNETGPQGETPLMLAARSGNLDSIKILLDTKLRSTPKRSCAAPLH